MLFSIQKSLISFLLVALVSTNCLTQVTAVDAYGVLSVSGTKLVNEKDEPVQLRGMSLFWSQWEPEFYAANTIDQLQNEWCTDVVRCAMAIESGGYLTDPSGEEQKVRTVVEACIEKGIYVIID